LTSISEQKKRQRIEAHKTRNAIRVARAGNAAARNFFSNIEISTEDIVALYWPIGSELDTEPALSRLHETGIACVLPVIKGDSLPLMFRRWQPSIALQPGPFRVPVPPETEDILIPTLIVVPLLAFDEAGYRLGYGGGFYDRTLAAIRPDTGCRAIGYGYAGQQVAKVVTDDYDQRLDMMVTETDVREFK
jgi:5-formyltetrahydrofolate cyclo-ligase